MVVLVSPQMGENIGKAARAMLNFGLTELRMVRPRDGWPNERAIANASGAHDILDRAHVFETSEEALADLDLIYATTARDRHMVKEVVTPREAAQDLRQAMARGRKCGILFGAERAGLTNDDVVLAKKIISVPINPAFASLNLAQAVLLVAYEWFQAGDDVAENDENQPQAIPATSQEMVGLFEHLEAELDETGFLYPPEKRPRMVRNLRNLFQKADLTHQDVQTFRGMIKALAKGRPEGRERE